MDRLVVIISPGEHEIISQGLYDELEKHDVVLDTDTGSVELRFCDVCDVERARLWLDDPPSGTMIKSWVNVHEPDLYSRWYLSG